MDTTTLDATFGPFVQAFAPLVSALNTLTVKAANVGASLDPLGKSVSVVVNATDALKKSFDGLVATVESLNAAVGKIGGGTATPKSPPPKLDKAGDDGTKGKADDKGGGVISNLASLALAAVMPEAGLAGLASGALSAAGGVGGLAAKVAGLDAPIEKFASTITSAIDAILGPIQQLSSAVAPFVEALNPSLMFVFNQAMRDVQATIGVALVPVIQVLTNSLRTLGGALLPLMQSLEPVMRSLTQACMGVFDTLTRLAVDILSECIPAFQFLADAMQIYAQYGAELWAGLRALVPVVMDVLKVFIPILGLKDTGGVLAAFKDTMHLLVESLLRFVAHLAKAFGRADIIAQMIENLNKLKNPAAGAKAAARDVQFKGGEDISRTMAQAAFAAQGTGGADKSEKEWLENLARSLDDVKNNGKSMEDIIKDQIATVTDAILNLPSKIARELNPLGHWPNPFRRAP